MMNSVIFDGDTDALDALGVPESLRFFATKTGWLLDKNTFFGRVIHPIKENPFAAEPDFGARLFTSIRPIPGYILSQIWGFFRAAWATRQSEAMIYLLDINSEYALHVPKQHVSAGHVNAKLDPTELPFGARLVGDFHSHCNFGAFHSGIDEADARKNDGLHVTIGKVDTITPEWAVMLAYSSFLWNLELDEICTGTVMFPPLAPPAEWLARIDEPAPITTIPAWTEHHMWDQWNNTWGFDEYNPWEPYIAGGKPTVDKNSWTDIDELLDGNNLTDFSPSDKETLEWAAWRLGDINETLRGLGLDLTYKVTALPFQNITKEIKA